MKVGSLVICIDNHFETWFLESCLEVPNKEDIYTVREVRKCLITGLEGILLEEIKNGKNKNGLEWGFYSFRFREIQEPIDANELIKERPLQHF